MSERNFGPDHQVTSVFNLDLVDEFLGIVVGTEKLVNRRRWEIEPDYESIRVDLIDESPGFQFSYREGMTAGFRSTEHSTFRLPRTEMEEKLAAVRDFLIQNGYSFDRENLDGGMVWVKTSWALYPLEFAPK